MSYRITFIVALFSFLAAVHAESPIRWEPLNEPGCGGWVVSLGVNPHRPQEILAGGDVLGVVWSDDRGKQWHPAFGFKSVEMGDFTYHPTDPNIVWVASMSGPYLSTDGGKTWIEKRGGMPKIERYFYSVPIEKILFDPNNPKRLLAFGGNARRYHQHQNHSRFGAVWESTDSGENWTEIAMVPPDSTQKTKGANIVGAAFAAGSSRTIYIAAAFRGVMRSDDGGKTWTEKNAGLPHRHIERIFSHPKKPDTLWASFASYKGNNDKYLPGLIYKSIDGGNSWTEISEGLAKHRDTNQAWLTSFYRAFYVSRSNPDLMYASDASWNGATMYKSENGGVSWKKMMRKGAPKNSGMSDISPAYPSGSGMTVLTIDPVAESTVYAAGAEYILQSTDSGKNWTDITSTRVGDAWRGRGYSGLCSKCFHFDPYTKNRSVLMAMDAGKCWVSTDNLKTWNMRGVKPGAWGGGNDATFAKDGRVYATTGQNGSDGGMIRSEKRGEASDAPWTPFDGEKNGLPPRSGGGDARGIYTLPDDSSKVWACVGERCYASVDSGEHWKKLSGDTESNLPDATSNWIAGDPTKPTRFYVSTIEAVFVTEDGKKFRDIGGPKVAGRMTVDSLGRLYLAAYRGKDCGLWRFDPKARGTAWTRLKDDWHLLNVAVDPTDPNRIMTASSDDPFHDDMMCLGVSISADGGKTWSDENVGLPVHRVVAVEFDPFQPERIVCGTGGCGFFIAKWPKTYRPSGK